MQKAISVIIKLLLEYTIDYIHIKSRANLYIIQEQ